MISQQTECFHRFALRRGATLALSSRVSYAKISQSRSISTFSTNLRICVRPTVLSVFQKRFIGEVAKENDETEPVVQDDMAPDATSAAQFDVSGIEPIEAREVPHEEPIDTARPTARIPGYDDTENVRTGPGAVNNQIFVGNLDFDIPEEDMRREFSRYGTVVNVKIIKDVRGMSKGYEPFGKYVLSY